MKLKRILVALVLSSVIPFAWSGQTTTHSKSMHWLNQKIHQVKSHLASDKKHRSDLWDNLKDIEIHISRLVKQQYQIQTKAVNTKNNIKHLKQSIASTKHTLIRDQQSLASLIQMEYKLGQENNIHIALQNKSIARKQRLTHYMHSINQKQANLTQSIQTKMNQLQTEQNSLTANLKNYQQTLKHIAATQAMLARATAHRLTIMKHMDKSIATHTQALSALLKQKKELMAAIAQANQDIPVTTHLNFTYNFGKKMAWPTQGRISQRFGQRVDHSQLTTDGIVIKAHMGQPVYAIANGVVVFSKWLPGYGLMMIINHGHGYMSLYGRNQQLLYHNGQVVKKGAMIATAGNTGGFKQSGLYFAIRKNGDAVNPSWYM